MIKCDKLRVGYREYKLIDSHDLLKQLGMHGKCDNNHGEIHYSKEYGKGALADTLVHELLHALWHIHVDEEAVEEEKAVTMLAHGLCQVIKDNPKFVKELQSLLS